jgi:hypothetical protein
VSALTTLVAAEIAQPVDPQVSDIANAIAALYPGSARAVLFYGSCLRETQLDGLMLDFYVIVSDYDAAYAGRLMALANRLVPPNVFPFAHANLSAKYAVLSEADFSKLNGPDASTVSVWARFAQPTRLVWFADEAARYAVTDAIAQASPTLFGLALPLVENTDPLEPWRIGFAQTYAAELRAERVDRSASIVDADPERYLRFARAIARPQGVDDRAVTMKRWRTLQRRGKWMSVVRLAKASFTFAGGIDYLAWKINRHAKTKITIKPWQRRWPLIAALFLVPKLLGSGAIR